MNDFITDLSNLDNIDDVESQWNNQFGDLFKQPMFQNF